MSGAYTPGPWVALDADSFDGCHYIPIETDQPVGPLLRLICEVRPDPLKDDGNISETDRANARLIAAAPDLLAAIRPFAIGQPRDITEADLIACERAYRKANGGDVARTSGMGEVS